MSISYEGFLEVLIVEIIDGPSCLLHCISEPVE
jgi:hypothetical protein